MMIDIALKHARAGFRVVPVSGKGPILKNWPEEATTNETQIRFWWSNYPTANVGLAMGGPERLIAIDVDGDIGKASLEALEKDHGDLPETLVAETGSGNGNHILFRVPAHQDALRLKNRKDCPGKKIDIKFTNGQIVGAGSTHPSGGVYRWLNDGTPIAELPDWLYDKIAGPENLSTNLSTNLFQRPPMRDNPPLEERARLAREWADKTQASIENEGGDEALFHAANGIYRGFDLPRSVAADVLLHYNQTRCFPSWPGSRLRYKLDQAEQESDQARPWGWILDERASWDWLLNAKESDPDPKPEKGARVAWINTAGIFEPLPPTKWLVPSLQICPGRPTMIAGYGFSGKTMAAQAAALAFAAGKAIWNKHSTRAGTARHFDHEQGRHATLKRYQRLACGHGIDARELGGRLSVACFPNLVLNHKDARDAYAKECEGVDLCLIDALRGAVPGVDENDSTIRKYIDILSAVSDVTGTAFVLIHHSGKGDGEHAAIRGSSAIFDGCGCVFEMKAEKTGPIAVVQTKGPAEAEDGPLKPFWLEISDVAKDNTPKAGVRVVDTDPAPPKDKYEERKKTVLAYIENNPGTSTIKICENVGGRKETLLAMLAEMDGRELVRQGTDRAQEWRVNR